MQMRNLKELSFPKLRSTSDYLSIHDNPDLTTIKFGSLVATRGYIEIYNNPKLQSVFFPKIKHIGEILRVKDNGPKKVPVDGKGTCATLKASRIPGP